MITKNPRSIVLHGERLRVYEVEKLIVVDPKARRRRRKYFGGEDWVFTFPAFWKIVRELNRTETRVLSWLIERLEWDEGTVSGYTQRRIGEELGMVHQEVSKALRALEEKSLVRKRRDGRNVYYVNPFLAWRGSDEVWREAVRVWPDPVAMMEGRGGCLGWKNRNRR